MLETCVIIEGVKCKLSSFQGPVDPFRQTAKTKAKPRDGMRASTVKVNTNSSASNNLCYSFNTGPVYVHCR